MITQYPDQHCELEKGFCRVYHTIYTQEYRRSQPCPATGCKHDTRSHPAPVPEDNGDTFLKAIERRIDFCQNLGYDGDNPLLDALNNLRNQILILADVIDEEESPTLQRRYGDETIN